MRRTDARPTPVPGNSLALCRRWNTPNRRSAKRMSKPAPLSSTVKAVGSPARRTKPIRAVRAWPVYFQALPSRFSSITRSSVGSPEASSAGLDLDLDPRSGLLTAQVVDDEAGDLRQVDRHARDRLRRQPRKREQRVDHAVHARGRAEHAVEMVVADAVEDARRSPP